MNLFIKGMGDESPDVLAARKVAKHLNTEHHEVLFSGDDACGAVRIVIKSLESYDITTIRASIGIKQVHFLFFNYVLLYFYFEKKECICLANT